MFQVYIFYNLLTFLTLPLSKKKKKLSSHNAVDKWPEELKNSMQILRRANLLQFLTFHIEKMFIIRF